MVVPLVGRSIPVIRDTYVDIAFGTGALKVTPAHDVNDYMLGEKYGLETIDIFNDDGTINGKVGIYEGMDRFELRRVIEGDLQRAGLLEKTEESSPKNTRISTVTGWRTSRTGASRASCGGGSAFPPTTCPRAVTWWPKRPRRRWRWPARRRVTPRCSSATCGRTRTADLVTGPDIIFFWVARMIMAGYEYRGEKPFGNVYFTGIVRDKIGRKMSKQLGNSPDPLDLIAQYGADGMRVAMLLSSSAGNDVMFDEALCEQGRNFGNKIWNAYRLVNGWTVDGTLAQSDNDRLAGEWFRQTLRRAVAELDGDFGSYRISEAFMLLYKLFWDDFSGWYLEMIKPAYGAPVDPRTVDEAKGFFDALLRLLHPFMPFVTEEIWQDLAPRAAGESIMVARQPQADGQADEALLARFELVKETITAVRNIRKQKNLPQREALTLEVIADANYPADYAPVLTKMANLSAIERVAEKDAAAAAFIVKTTQYFVPLGDRIDREAEIAKLGEELTYYEGFLQSVERKLSNERFVQSAPAAVVEKERAKKADAEAKIAAIREQLAALN